MIKVYIASPYTIGNTAENVKAQLDMANELLEHGFSPYVPLLTHFLHMAHPQPDEVWFKLDFDWLLMCDCVLRLPGESAGADREVELARHKGLPVFYGRDDFRENVGSFFKVKEQS